jgi:hypothetical protein
VVVDLKPLNIWVNGIASDLLDSYSVRYNYACSSSQLAAPSTSCSAADPYWINQLKQGVFGVLVDESHVVGVVVNNTSRD